MIDREALSAGVRECLADTLAVEPDEITPEASFGEDLGGDSLDDLDLSFRLEKKFGVKTNFGELVPLWQVDDSGALLAEAIDAFRNTWPFLTEDELTTLAETNDFWSIVTVEFIERLVDFRFQQASTADNKDPVS